MLEPQVGDRVRYTVEGGEYLTALVSRVWSGGSVDLTVFHPARGPQLRHSVPYGEGPREWSHDEARDVEAMLAAKDRELEAKVEALRESEEQAYELAGEKQVGEKRIEKLELELRERSKELSARDEGIEAYRERIETLERDLAQQKEKADGARSDAR